MGTLYDLTKEELDSIMRYINSDEAPVPTNEVILKFQNSYFAFQRKITSEMMRLNKSNARLESRIEKLENQEFKKVEQGIFQESGIDSVDIAQVILYLLQQLQSYRITKNKVIYILYNMYCSWLSSQKERLVMEHPVATEWGPQFWRVYKRIDIKQEQSSDVWKRLTSESPAIAAFVRNSVNKYHDYSENEFKEYFVKSLPYKKAAANMNGGKWNKEISDSDIYDWKKQ